MMFRICLFAILMVSSCGLFPKFRQNGFTYTVNGLQQSARLIVPKGYKRAETSRDSLGNEERFFYYPDGSYLFFVHAADTSKMYLPIQYGENIARELYHAVYFKGIDAGGTYWRESRIYNFKAGYGKVQPGSDWLFDSSLNYFVIHSVR